MSQTPLAPLTEFSVPFNYLGYEYTVFDHLRLHFPESTAVESSDMICDALDLEEFRVNQLETDDAILTAFMIIKANGGPKNFLQAVRSDRPVSNMTLPTFLYLTIDKVVHSSP